MIEPAGHSHDTTATAGSPRIGTAWALYVSAGFAWTIVAAGILLRVAQYAANRSLWVDESFLALNIIHGSLKDLAGVLFHNQAAPLGYLFLSKAAVLFFGTGEPALRLVPLASGIASCILFLFVARRVLSAGLAPVAIALFAVSDRLIYYASEVKQYSSDVAVTCALLLAGLVMLERDGFTNRDMAMFAAIGLAGVWMAHPAIFILAGTGLALSGTALVERRFRKALQLTGIGAIWALSFGVNFLVSLGELTKNTKHQRFWDKSFMPMPPTSPAGGEWFRHTFLEIFNNPLALRPEWFALGLCFAGCVWLFVTRRDRFFLILSPVMLCLLASGLRKYPFSSRLLLYLVPVFILCTVKGIELFAERAGKAGPMLAIAFSAVLLFAPSLDAARALGHPRTHEEIKPVLQFVATHRQPGDVVFVYYGAQYPFQYYAQRYGFAEGEHITGKIARRNPEKYQAQLDALRGNARVWIIISHPTRKRGLDEQRYYLDYLDSIGTRLDGIEEIEAAAYLYDLRPAAVYQLPSDSPAN